LGIPFPSSSSPRFLLITTYLFPFSLPFPTLLPHHHHPALNLQVSKACFPLLSPPIPSFPIPLLLSPSSYYLPLPPTIPDISPIHSFSRSCRA
ncbi:hypothetical protein BO79DRAFT_170088, partial [Aspergillus costaricaensis CBS 115574]